MSQHELIGYDAAGNLDKVQIDTKRLKTLTGIDTSDSGVATIIGYIDGLETSLTTMINDNKNAYDDTGLFTLSSLASGALTHQSGANSFYIQELAADEKYNKILIFGKYTATVATDFFTIVQSNSVATGSAPHYAPPASFYYGDNIRGTAVAADGGKYHFSHIIEAIPRYITFGNVCGNALTNLEFNYVKLK